MAIVNKRNWQREAAREAVRGCDSQDRLGDEWMIGHLTCIQEMKIVSNSTTKISRSSDSPLQPRPFNSVRCSPRTAGLATLDDGS